MKQNSEAKLRRRVFMKALGVGIAAPLAFKFARMAGAAPTGRPCRLICYYFPHGVPNEHMDMEPYIKPGVDEFSGWGEDVLNGRPDVHVNPGYTLNTRSGFNLLNPLEPYRSSMHIVRGLYQAGEFGTHDSIGAILTGDGTGPSIDQAIAKAIGANTLTLGAVPRLDADTLDGTNGVLVRDEADWIIPEADAVAKADELFGAGGAPPPPPASPAQDDFRTAALDTSIEEITAFRSEVQGLTQADDKLSKHLAALEKLKSGNSSSLGIANTPGCESPAISHIEELRGLDVGKPEWEARYYLEGSNFEKIAEAQAEIAAYSVLCGHAQIATVQNMWASADIPMPGVLPHRPSEPHHLGVSHKGYNGDLTNTDRMDYATCQEWFIARMARMCEILDQPDPFDPDHTALENTIIYGFSEIADGDLHGKELSRQWRASGSDDIFQYYPAIIVGGGAGMLKPGSLITCDNRPIADLLLTLGDAMGANLGTFGTHGTQAFGELLV